MKMLLSLVLMIFSVNTLAQFPAPSNLKVSIGYVQMGDWGYCCGETVNGPSYCTGMNWNSADTSLTEAVFSHYNVYNFNNVFPDPSDDTVLITSTKDTVFETKTAYLGYVWVTAIYSNPQGESLHSNIFYNNSLPIGLSQPEIDERLGVFYHSSQQSLHFNTNLNVESVVVLSLNGEVISKEERNSPISLQDVNPGIYLIKFNLHTGIVVKKISVFK